MNSGVGEQKWTEIITPKNKWYQLDLKEIVKYKDLLFLFVRRDFVAQFKQTVLGPLWFLIQPILETAVLFVVFHLIARLSTDGIPPLLFYLTGNILWLYFSECLITNANTFSSNSHIYGKVYFPRLIMPISVVISNLFKLVVRFILLAAVFIFYYFQGEIAMIGSNIWIVVLLIILMAGYGFSLGIIFSSITTKYRDMKFLLTFGVKLLMYVSGVMFPLSMIPEKYQVYARLNPFLNVIESFKAIVLGKGSYSWMWIGYSFALLLVIFFISLILFKRTERNFMDTV